MKQSLTLGSIWGIPIGLHYSWFLVFALITFSLSTSYFPMASPRLPVVIYAALAVITSLLFFASVLAHELGHSFVALREKIPVKGITLFIFGGLAQIGREPQSAGAEFRIAIAGPLVSLALAGLFGLVRLVGGESALFAVPSAYLMRINLLLALFNMIPGFPLDGGRVLRSIVWRLSGSNTKATRAATISGQAVAYGFIGFGVASLFIGNFANGLWLVFIGWYLLNAASMAAYQAKVEERLRGATVSQAMTQNYGILDGLTPLSLIVEERVVPFSQHFFFVTGENGAIRGMLSLEDILNVPQSRWRFTTAEQAMTPNARLLQVDPSADLMETLRKLDEANLSHAPVVMMNQPVGLLSRENIFRYLRLRAKPGT
jgi:Zn-dependent protease